MKVSDLQFGDVINSYWPKLKWYDIPGRSIQAYQREKYKDICFPEIKATHSVIKLGGCYRYFEVTTPKARYGDILADWEEGRVYTVSRYNWSIPEAERSAFLEACEELNGTKYDYLELLDIAIKQIIGWPYSRPLSIFDLGRKRKVCSVAVISCYLRWWELYGKEKGIPRPFSGQDAEVCCPADFDNNPGYFRFLGYLERD